jgi:aspartate racemase
VDFAEIEVLQHQGDWAQLSERMVRAAQSLERAGAAGLIIATNTMHKLAPAVEASVSIPLLHIADATADRVQAQGLNTVALLGTRFSMEEDFYRGRLQTHHGLQVLIPSPPDRDVVHRVIYDELCQGLINPDSRSRYRTIMAKLVAAGATGIILGCTEIELLVQPEDTSVPLFPTTRLHAEKAVQWALAGCEATG